MSRFLAVLILLSPQLAFAKERRELTGMYISKHEIAVDDPATTADETVKLEDCLDLKEMGPSQLSFSFYIHGDGGHICAMSGNAKRLRGSTYVYREPSQADVENSKECVLKLHVSDRAFQLEDVDDECGSGYCGLHARIDGTRFPRTKSERMQCPP